MTKHIYDEDFKYTQAINTDVKKTIERARKRQELAAKVQAENAAEAKNKVVNYGDIRKAK